MSVKGSRQRKQKEILFYSTTGETSFMSNFHLCKIVIDGETYGSVEHYYQSQKVPPGEMRDKIKDAPTPKQAKKLGRAAENIVPGWKEKRVDVMRKALRAKFTQNEDLKAKLLATGDAVLREDSPDDMFWGLKGEDMMGKLLMELRSELAQEGRLRDGISRE